MKIHPEEEVPKTNFLAYRQQFRIVTIKLAKREFWIIPTTRTKKCDVIEVQIIAIMTITLQHINVSEQHVLN